MSIAEGKRASAVGPVVLLGADGMLGRAWSDLLSKRAVETRELTYPSFDVNRPADVHAAVAPGTRTVVNCTAWTDVDGAEAREDEATAVNGVAVGRVAERCAEVGATLVHYGTDYVFSGSATTPYRTDDEPQPINAYGRSKAYGERRIRESGCEHLLVRTSWLYAPWGKNFVRTMDRLAREQAVLRVVDDQVGRPTSAGHLARTSARLLEVSASGIYHVTDGGQCSWFELASAVAAHANPACRMERCSSDELARVARRPAYSVLDVGKTEALLGPLSPWQTNVAGVLREMLAATSG